MENEFLLFIYGIPFKNEEIFHTKFEKVERIWFDNKDYLTEYKRGEFALLLNKMINIYFQLGEEVDLFSQEGKDICDFNSSINAFVYYAKKAHTDTVNRDVYKEIGKLYCNLTKYMKDRQPQI